MKEIMAVKPKLFYWFSFVLDNVIEDENWENCHFPFLDTSKKQNKKLLISLFSFFSFFIFRTE